MSTANRKTGVVLMTYGSATTAEGTREYFERIYKGKASEELIRDFENRYRLVGRSPLVDITRAQAAALEARLGSGYIARAGMRHSAPFIEEAVAECKAAGADSLLGIVLSPQFSSFIMEGYTAAFAEAARKHGFSEGKAVVAGPWPSEPHFAELLASRVEESLAKLGGNTPVIFTTHSLPQRVVKKDPQYLEQLQSTISAVRAKLPRDLEWYGGYQSAGHTPEEWLKPDLTDILAQLRDKKSQAVLIVPIQFLSDHLEVLYDLDIAARKQCEDFGIDYNRIELPNTNPLFIEALAGIAAAHSVK
ncbi:MAG TPA: ferrochelatase [Candidatus Paceibacterota bacterium]|nr:ferrochelatase [Candidatus Paceibacterota bacterium]